LLSEITGLIAYFMVDENAGINAVKPLYEV
jgi:hypothetical protein